MGRELREAGQRLLTESLAAEPLESLERKFDVGIDVWTRTKELLREGMATMGGSVEW